MEKSFTYKLLVNINLRIAKAIYKLDQKINVPGANSFDSLTPIDNATDKQVYFIALKEALTKDDVKNIALTGTYGSGKSSIIKTFQKNYIEYKYLNISLASFKDNIDDDSIDNESLNRLIELSILQQIFYKERHKDIPDSRFKRIKNINSNKILVNSFLFLIWGLSLVYLFKHKELATDFSELGTFINSSYFKYISLIIALLGCYYLAIKLVRVFNNSKLNKLNIQSADIEIGDNNDKSILNHHLDEILYFFEVTKYDTVIIEDLDRFNDTEIFTKLRELNNLINGSKQIGRKIVFLYAIRDNMFQDKDRTKFFDFIIPVIPIINPSNSNEIFKNKLNKLNSVNIPTEDFIDDVSIFIEDMRLLTNICNEYSLYKDNLGKRLNQNNLFAMIIYKNLCPDDFAELHNGKGNIYKLISNKPEYIKDKIATIDKSIFEIKKQIKDIESETITDIEELRAIYINELRNQIPDAVSIKLNNSDYNFSKLIETETFELLKSTTQLRYNYYTLYSGSYYHKYENTIGKTFNDIQEAVNPDYTYDEREEFIYDNENNKENKLKQEIEKLTSEKNDMRSWSLKQVLNSVSVSSIISSSEAKNKKLISYLLVNGYIDENYYDYISYFHEGSITKQDWEFLQNVKSQMPTPYDFKLNKIENLLRKFKDTDFEKDAIFNISLLDFLLRNKVKYSTKIESTFKLLSIENDEGFNFIKDYINKGLEIDMFINLLSEKWSNFWGYIEKKSLFTDEKKDEYLYLILKHSDLSDIKKQSLSSDLISYMASKQDFFTFINDEIPLGKVENIIEELNIEFITIENPITNEDLFDFIYTNCYYVINQTNITTILNYNEQDITDIETANYTTIQYSVCEDLKSNIQEKIDIYVKDVLLKLPDNHSENEEKYIELLNNTEISSKNVISLITKIETKVNDISLVKAPGIPELLFGYLKVQPIWKNIYIQFQNNGKKIDDSLIKFLNYKDNYVELSKSLLKESTGDYTSFRDNIMLSENLNDDAYSYLVKSIHFTRDKLSFEKLTLSKVKDLIKEVLNVTNENYELLKEHFANQHINLLEKNPSKFITELEKYSIDSEDMLLILSSSFTKNQKIELILKAEEDLLFEEGEIADKVCEVISNTSKLDIKYSLIKGLFSKAKNIGNRLKIINIYFKDFSVSNIDELLILLPTPYSTISIKGRRPEIGKTDMEVQLVKNLLSVKYISSKTELKHSIKINTKTK